MSFSLFCPRLGTLYAIQLSSNEIFTIAIDRVGWSLNLSEIIGEVRCTEMDD